jgi:hypothetical protein
VKLAWLISHSPWSASGEVVRVPHWREKHVYTEPDKLLDRLMALGEGTVVEFSVITIMDQEEFTWGNSVPRGGLKK